MKPITELRATMLGALDAEYMQGAIDDLSKAVRNNVEDAVNAALEDSGFLQTCLNCKHFEEEPEHCILAMPPARPPARVIAFGCPRFAEETADVPPALQKAAESHDRLIQKPYVTPVPPKPVPRALTGFDDMDDDIPF